MAAPRRVVILAFPAVQPLDVTGPAEVFAEATKLRTGAYEVQVVAEDPAPIPTPGGYAILPAGGLELAAGAVDTLVVAGGRGARRAGEGIVAWIAEAATRSRRVASVCTGAFLARAGLLDGRRATTHWAWCEALAREFPAVTVEPDPIWIADGRIRTSAGVTAGMDLALALVEEDHGHELALRVARALVLYMKRPGGQSQFSVALAAEAPERPGLRDLQAWALDHLGDDLSVPALAARAHMSPRHFARAFRAEAGMTPGAWVELARVEQARLRLEGSRDPVEAVARACGFGTPETLRRAFARRLGVSPAAYRARFAA